MGLARVSNPKKLRRLERLVGESVTRAYADWFEYIRRPEVAEAMKTRQQMHFGRTLLVFGASGKTYAVTGNVMRSPNLCAVQPYDHDPPLRLTETGIAYGGPPE